VGPVCQWLSQHAPCPDWLPGVALSSHSRHKGADPSDRRPCPKPRCLTVRASRRHRCPNPAAVPVGKRHYAASCSEASRRASLPSAAAPRFLCRADAPHATPPLCVGRQVLVGVEQRRHTPFRHRVVGCLRPPGPHRRYLG
jgi:hypothetical protein